MKDFFTQLLGEHPVGFHLAGVLFAIIGALLIKRHYWLKHKAQCEGVCEHPKFDPKYWFRDNWQDVGMSVLVGFLFVRFVDVFLHMLEVHQVTILGVTIPVTADSVFYYLLFGALAQIWLHKKYRKK